LPFEKSNGKLKVAVSDPLDLDGIDKIRFNVEGDVDCYIARPSQLRDYIQNQYEQDTSQPSEEQAPQEGRQTQQEIQDDADDDTLKHSIDATTAELAEEESEDGFSVASIIGGDTAAAAEDDGPIIKLCNLIIDNACRMRASDIHIEPMEDRVRIRYRVDGVCLERDSIPKNMQAAMLARLKILAGMDIAERRLPQDGRIKREIDGQDIDFRVSALPANHGESFVLRILRPDSVNIGIQSLGFENDDYKRFLNIIKKPNGIFLVTGPTGSGKTTTLYAALQELNKPDRKIITAEDPVEYNFAGMNQCQVKPDIGLTFDNILRAMLRQAPNIILVGEIRDSEVADIAIQAALTGHLVFSTLHTNDAVSAITRLIDMGVKPFLVASSIQAILAQRLVRTICPNCRVVDENPDPHYLKLLDISEQEVKDNTFYKGKGCKECEYTGYKGRSGIFELVEVTNELRELAFSRAPTSELRKTAQNSGMKMLADDGKIKIFNGVTTPREVARLAQADEE
jgi:type IV pilus assembly protein PilB